MKKLVAILTALSMMAFASIGVSAAKGKPDPKYSAKGTQKVVYHVNYDNPKRQLGAMRNIQNHINAVGAKNLDLRVVMHGKGFTLLKRANEDPKFRSKVDNLKRQGIKFNICANTIRGKKLNAKRDLHDVSSRDIVPSGVAEIAHLQAKGYAYVKP